MFFSDINIETPAVAGVSDQVDLKVSVKEKNTGSFMVGAGLSSSEGIVGSVNVTQANFLGTGNRVSAQVNTGRVNKTYAFNFTDPYFTPEGISLNYELYRKDVNTSSLSIASYNTSSYGAGIRFGIPLNEKHNISFGLSGDMTEVSGLIVGTSPSRYISYCSNVTGTQNASGCSMNSINLSMGWADDSRDDVIMPRKGELRKLSAEISVPGLDIQTYKVVATETYYKELNSNLTLMLNGQFGVVNTYGDKELPFFKNFYVGGVNTVRGYTQGGIGPYQKDAVSSSSMFMGGNKQVVMNAELFMPLPFLKNNDQFRLSAFVDAGNVFEKSETLNLGDLRFSAGLGAMWISPFGPLKIIYAHPFNNQITDKTESIQFQMGQQF
jgi:outer membrane protein insertion porin family